MLLQGRNGKGVWEPKVASGTGYTVSAQVTTRPGQAKLTPGIPPTVHVGFTDAVKSNMSDKNPFYVRVGICYSDTNGEPPNGNFTITRGYKSWGGNGTNAKLPDYRPYYTQLVPPESAQNCDNLDNNNVVVDAAGSVKYLNLDAMNGCPAKGLMGAPATEFPTTPLSLAGSLAEVSNPDGTPVDASKYFFDTKTGMLFFFVQQTAPNAHGAMPLGSCHNPAQVGDDPACPGANDLDTYFGCPAQGCSSYSVVLNDLAYKPGPSACAARAPGGNLYDQSTGFALTEPPQTHFLADKKTNAIVAPLLQSAKSPYQHWVPKSEPSCPKTTTVAPAGRTADAGPRSTAVARLFDPTRWLRPELATKVAELVRDPLAGMHIRRPPDMDPLMLSQICTARGG
jgi:hypothetical protein